MQESVCAPENMHGSGQERFRASRLLKSGYSKKRWRYNAFSRNLNTLGLGSKLSVSKDGLESIAELGYIFFNAAIYIQFMFLLHYVAFDANC